MSDSQYKLIANDAAMAGKHRATIEKLTAEHPYHRSFTALHWPDSDMDTLQRLIALKPWESKGVDVIHIEWIEEIKTTPVSPITNGVESTGHRIEQGKIFSFYFATHLHPTKSGAWFSVRNNHFRLPMAYDESLAKDNEAHGYLPTPELLEAIKQEEARGLEAKKSLAPRTAALGTNLCFTGDNIHRAAITAFARAAEWQDGEGYFKGLQQEYKNLKITVSLPNGDEAASLWEFLRRGGAATVKAHYALWARYYEQVPDGFEMQDVVVNVNDFCRDLGYTKATSGGYKPDAKRRAMRLLEALTTTEMAATYQVPGTKKGHIKTRRLKGTIWRRGLQAEERDTYEDLLGNARTGDPGQWIPQSFSFSPGAWHADKEWRRHNKYVGKIGAGLMRLDVRYDEWAIFIGGYLGTLARTGQYRNRRLKISTILENTGLAQADTHRQTEHREKFYRALDRFIEEKIIVTYKTDGFDDSDVDPEDLVALAEYGAKDPFPAGDWRAAVVEFTFDFAADMHRLETRKIKAIAAKTKRAKKENPPKDPTRAA